MFNLQAELVDKILDNKKYIEKNSNLEINYFLDNKNILETFVEQLARTNMAGTENWLYFFCQLPVSENIKILKINTIIISAGKAPIILNKLACEKIFIISSS